MDPNDPLFNPIGGDNFQIGRPMRQAPLRPHVRAPKRAVPEVDDLFAVQKALVKALNHIRDADHDDPAVRRAEERIEGAYRNIRNWLAKHGNEAGV